MHKGRLEAFSDGVIAIIITIMVLELRAPQAHEPDALRPLIPAFLSYVLSFVFVGIYWNNHHHMLQACRRVNGAALWANLHLLFWLSLVPFVTRWMGESHFAPWPVAAYGGVLLATGFAYYVLARILVANHAEDSTLASAMGSSRKAQLSLVLYAVAIPAAFIHTGISCGIYAFVALMWLVPNPRVEKLLGEGSS